MANFTNETFTNYNDYMTPYNVWELIKDYIPKNKKIWSPFYGDGKQKDHFQKLGFDIIHNDEDFFKNNKGEIIIDNPPFSIKKEILIKCKELNKPFILLLPITTLCTKYFITLFKNDKIQFIIPNKRIDFLKLENNVVIKTKNRCNFDTVFICYKMDLDQDIIYL
tara:strand:+ start:154 stop:648 length:495 start_codon:yes stop_codon:yes gene_type:complete